MKVYQVDQVLPQGRGQPRSADGGSPDGFTGAAGSRSPMQSEDQIHRAEVGHMRATCRRSRVTAITFDHAAAKGGT